MNNFNSFTNKFNKVNINNNLEQKYLLNNNILYYPQVKLTQCDILLDEIEDILYQNKLRKNIKNKSNNFSKNILYNKNRFDQLHPYNLYNLAGKINDISNQNINNISEQNIETIEILDLPKEKNININKPLFNNYIHEDTKESNINIIENYFSKNTDEFKNYKIMYRKPQISKEYLLKLET